MKVAKFLPTLLMVLVLIATVVGCAPAPQQAPAAAEPAQPAAVEPAKKVYTYKDMVVGFLQTGSEGGWRAANSAPLKKLQPS
jgi:hypothetical protein